MERHILTYMDQLAEREGVNRSDAIRSIIGLPTLDDSANTDKGYQPGTAVPGFRRRRGDHSRSF